MVYGFLSQRSRLEARWCIEEEEPATPLPRSPRVDMVKSTKYRWNETRNRQRNNENTKINKENKGYHSSGEVTGKTHQNGERLVKAHLLGSSNMRSVRRGSIAVGVDRGPKEQNHSWKQKDSGQIGVTGIRPVPRVGFATLVRHLHPLECYLAQPTAYLDSPACGLSPIGLHPTSLVRFSGDLAAASVLLLVFWFVFSDLIVSLHIFSTVSLYLVLCTMSSRGNQGKGVVGSYSSKR